MKDNAETPRTQRVRAQTSVSSATSASLRFSFDDGMELHV